MSRAKRIRRAIYTTVAAVCAVVVGVFLVAHTRVFENYVRSKLIHVADAELGSPVSLRKLSFSWTHLGVTLHDITIRGRSAPGQQPLFQARKLTVQVEMAPLLRGNFKLGKVALNHPVVHFELDRQGETNFPVLSSATSSHRSGSAPPSSAVKSLFSLGIRRLIIANGTIYYNDEKIPLSADLADFGASVRFSPTSQKYSGTIGYRDGRISARNLAPVQSAARLAFTADSSGITCNPLTIGIAGSRLSLYATVQNYSDPKINGTFSFDLSTGEIARVLRTASLPAGTISANGTVQYRSVLGRSLLDVLQLKGTLSSSRLALRMRQFSAPVTSLQASYTLENGNLRITSLRGQVLGGSLNATGGELSLTGAASSYLQATILGVSLQAVGQALPASRYDRLSLAGSADICAQLSWASHFANLKVDSHVMIHPPPRASLRATQIPLGGVVQIAYDQAQNRAAFGNSHLRVGSTALELDGLLAKHSNLKVVLSSGNLHEFSQLVDKIVAALSSAPEDTSPFPMPELSGRARFDGRVLGSLDSPELHGYLSAKDVGIRSTRWKTIRGAITLSPSNAALSDGILLSRRLGRVQVDASLGLRHWSFEPTSPVTLHAAVAHLRIDGLQSAAHLNYPVNGVLSGDVSVAGTRENPSEHGWIHIESASAWQQPVTLATITFDGGGSSMHAALAVETPAGAVTGNLAYDFSSKHYQLETATSGVQLHKIEFVKARHLPVSGTLVGMAGGTGSIDNPELAAHFQIARLEYDGQKISGAESQLNLANGSMNFSAKANLDNGTLEGQGQVKLTGDYMTTASVDVQSIDVGMLAARFSPGAQPGLKGSAQVHAEIQGPLKAPSQLVIRAEVPAAELQYQTVRVALVHPLQLEYRDGVATLQKSEIKGTGIELTFQGAVPVRRGATFKVAANGHVSMNLLQQVSTSIQSSGQVQVAIEGEGTFLHPALRGDLRLQNVSLTSASFPVAMSGINGDVRLSGDRLEITTLSGNVNGGAMTAQGAVNLGTNPTFDVALSAKSVDVNYPAGIRSRFDCNLRFNGAPSRSALTGRVVIDYLGFTRKTDVISLASQFGSSGGGLSTPAQFKKNMTLRVAVQSSSELSLASSQLSVQGAANLEIVGTLARPVVLGRATLTGGELFFIGKRYEIKSGTIEFANPVRTSPSVNLYATTTVDQYSISLHFLGPIDEMKTRFTSTPALPPADIINLLAFGQTTEEAAASSATPGSLGAESVLAQGVASQISGKIQKLAGISQLSISPILANGQQNPGAQVAIQQRVSGRLLVTISTNTAQTQSTAVQVQYRLGHGLSVSALRDQYGGYGVDVHLHKSF